MWNESPGFWDEVTNRYGEGSSRGSRIYALMQRDKRHTDLPEQEGEGESVSGIPADLLGVSSAFQASVSGMFTGMSASFNGLQDKFSESFGGVSESFNQIFSWA